MNGLRPAPGCPHRELAVGWALHCLEPAEEAQLAAHLPACTECRRTVREAEEVGAALAVAVPDAAPPDELERRVLAAVGDAGTRPGTVSMVRRPSWRRALTAAAALVLVAVSTVLGVQVAQLDGERDRIARQAAEMSRVVDRLAAPDARRVALTTGDGRPKAVLLAERGQLTLIPTALPANAVDRQVYVLWGLGSRGSPVALGGFDVSPEAPIAHPVGSPPRAKAFTAFAVSLEPGRTPPAGPSNIMASGTVEN